MSRETVTNYFLKGFHLANRNLDIYLISIGIQFSLLLINVFRESPLRIVLSLIILITAILSLSYQISIPKFLALKQQGEKLAFHQIWSVVWKNANRLAAALFVGFVLVVLLTISLIIGIAISSPPGETGSAIKNFSTTLSNWNPFSLIIFTLSSIFMFTPIYFSVENQGVLTSMKKSVSLSFKHLNFILLLGIIVALDYTVIMLIKDPFQHLLGILGQALTMSINIYLAFIISASTLLFYQSHRS